MPINSSSIQIQSPADIGFALRAVRQTSKVRLDDLALSAGVSKQFAQDVEYGKPTVQLGRVIQLLGELGLTLSVDVPSEARGKLAELQQNGIRA
jgi:transcriptional regulator with XRE-family HTH domain